MKLAEKIYAAYRAALTAAQREQVPATLDEREDKGAGWFAVANAREQICEAPAWAEPWTYEFETPIEPRTAGGKPFKEKLPTSAEIRPMRAGDLCVSPYEDIGMVARVAGLEAKILGERLDLADANVVRAEILDADGEDAADMCRAAYLGSCELPEFDSDNAWYSVAFALMVQIEGSRASVRTRSPGAGTITVGPLRLRHTQVHSQESEFPSRWDAYFAALSMATSATEAELRGLRVEDIIRVNGAYEALKKSAENRAVLKRVQRLSSLSSAGPPSTSQT